VPPPKSTIFDGGVVWTTGGGSSSTWKIPSQTPPIFYCANYDLCTPWYAFDGTASDLIGKSIDFAGPGYGGGPWTFTIDLGESAVFTHWRVAGHQRYAMGAVELRYQRSTGQMVTVPGSNFTWDRLMGGLQSAAFEQPVTAQVWQVYIKTHSNPDMQSRYQLYLSEVQFGVLPTLPPSPSPP
jgi:hypothetical protein